MRKGWRNLALARREVIVEVLEEPSRGVFGLGRAPGESALATADRAETAAPPPPATHCRCERPDRETGAAAAKTAAAAPERAHSAPRRSPLHDYEVSEEDDGLLVEAEEVPEADQDDEAQIAKVVLGEILETDGDYGADRRAAGASRRTGRKRRPGCST